MDIHFRSFMRVLDLAFDATGLGPVLELGMGNVLRFDGEREA